MGIIKEFSSGYFEDYLLAVKQIRYDAILLEILEKKEQYKNLINELPITNNFEEIKNFIEKNKIDEDIKKEFEEKIFERKLDIIKQLVFEILLNKDYNKTIQKRKISELISNFITKEFHIYTIRNDIKREIWIYENGIYVPYGASYVKEITRKIIGENYYDGFIKEILAKIEVDTYIDEKDFFKNENPNEIAVLNGILNLKTKELKPFTPEKRFFNKIPVIFDPEKKPDKIIKFFKDVLKNEEDLLIMQELFGYVLYREYFIEKAFMFLGTGRNGKSKTLELLKRFVGPENVVNIPLQDLSNDNFALANLHNKLVNISGDISNQDISNSAWFKALTGRDLITANRKYLNPITFVNYAKLIFSANQLPRTYDLTPAFFHRWIILEFPYTFLDEKEYNNLSEDEKQSDKYKLANPNIIDEILNDDELSGLLNLALEGLQRLFKNKDFSYSKSVEEVRQMWLRKSDSFFAFMVDCLEEDFEGYIEKSELRKAYSKYCQIFKIKPVSDKVIKIGLENHFGATQVRITTPNQEFSLCWYGIKFKNDIVEYEIRYRENKINIKEESLSDYESSKDKNEKNYDDSKRFYYFKSFKMSNYQTYQIYHSVSTLYSKIDRTPIRVKLYDKSDNYDNEQENTKLIYNNIYQNVKKLLIDFKQKYVKNFNIDKLPLKGTIQMLVNELNLEEQEIIKILDELKKVGDIYEPEPYFIDIIY